MEKIILQKREITGKSNKKLLEDNITPAVVYNSKGESTNVQLPTSIASQIAREATSTTIIDADSDGKEMKVIVKDLDINPLTDELRHISFFEIDESKEMVFSIPFTLTGVSPAVKNNLGILVHVLPSIDVKGKLSKLVDSISVDISVLEHPGQTISVEDVELPEDMSLINEEMSKAAIATITQLQKQEVIETDEEESDEETTEEGEATEEAPSEE